jgi:D-beta-D-heptose 7-phosphate kinase/D-beta-D-heptose 1-phosphate adenosyltransferase
MTKISELINKNHQKRARIAVIGDCMIDEYYKVKVKRISPESPVPVMLSGSDQSSYILPGGAANVAAQFKHWNVDCTLFGLMSSDDMIVFQKSGITCACVQSQDWTTQYRVPRKRRFVDGQNLIRWDIESDFNNDDEIDNLCELLEHHLENQKYDIVIFADYDKGMFKDLDKTQQLINICRDHKVPTIVDPKDEPIEKWMGCTYFKPNSIEAEKFTGIHHEENQLVELAQRLDKSSIIVTRGGSGVTSISEGKIAWYLSFKEIPPKNFSGAGDCFAAFFALAIANDFEFNNAIEIAYEAGKVYVQREHNKPLLPLDLYDTKFVHPIDLKNRDFKLVATNGCYDLTHSGHVATFEYAKSKGDKLAVLINSDESIKNIKGPDRPIIPLEQRMKMVAALECVDYVIPFNEDTPINLIKEIRPDVLVKADDWKEKGIRGAEFVKEICFAPLVDGVSTTSLIKKIRGNND